MLLYPSQIELRDLARDFVRREIAPFAADWDKLRHTPIDVLQRLGKLGFFGVCVPERWGGAGADFVSYVLIMEEIAFGDAGVANMIAATNSPYCAAVNGFGTDAQKEKWLRPAASGRMGGAILLTEPHAGSDAAAIKTAARKRGDRYVINGTKCFITSGRSAELAMVLAVTDPYAGKRGISCFLTRTDAPGYVVTREEDKLGHRSNDTCEISLENLDITAEDLLGNEGDGLRIALASLDNGRIGVAAQSVGVAQAALDAAVTYARQRQTFGKPIIEHQAVSFMLAEMATKVEVARQMYLHAATMKDAGISCIKEASMAKLYAAQMAEEVTSAAIQIHGGYGYIESYPVAKFWRDCRVFQIYDGTNEVQKLLIARELAAGR